MWEAFYNEFRQWIHLLFSPCWHCCLVGAAAAFFYYCYLELCIQFKHFPFGPW